MACVFVEGFEYPNITNATLPFFGISLASFTTGGVAEPVGSPGGNGARRLNAIVRSTSGYLIEIPPISGGIVSFLVKQNGASAIHAEQRLCGLRSAATAYIVEVLAVTTIDSTGLYEGLVRILVGGVEVASNISLDLSEWTRLALVYTAVGTDVTSVSLYQDGAQVGTWTGTQAVADVEAVVFGGGGVGPGANGSISLDSITLWDDPVNDVAVAARQHWVCGVTCDDPAAETFGDWSSFDGANSPSGNIDVRVASGSESQGALTVTAGSALDLGFSPLPLAEGDILAVTPVARALGSASLTTMSLNVLSGAALGPVVTQDVQSLSRLDQTLSTDPATNSAWTIASVDALAIRLEANQ